MRDGVIKYEGRGQGRWGVPRGREDCRGLLGMP